MLKAMTCRGEKMSVSYFMACEKCKECYWVAQDGFKFFTFYSREPQCMQGIGEFLGKHVLCGGDGPKLMSEYCVEDYTEIEWPKCPQTTSK
jgi:hypothetical protein